MNLDPDKSLRILFVVQEFPALSERFILDQALGLLASGCDVEVFSFFGPRLRDGQVHGDFTASDLVGRTHSPRVPGGGYFNKRVWSLVAGLAMMLRKPVRAWRLFRRVGWSRPEWTCLYFLFDGWLKGRQPYDVIHFQFGTLGVIGQLAKESGRHAGVVTVSFRGYDISREVQKRGPALYERLFDDVDMCFPNSEFFGDRLRALGCPTEKVLVQHSGIDVGAFPFRGVRQPDPARLRLLSVGRLVEKKGFSTALEAVAALASRYPGTEYTIIGTGPLRGRLLHEARILGIEERVSLPGPLTQEAIRDRLAQSDVMIAPSVTAANGDQDGPVNVLKEAMAIGLPVIATAHGGIPELVQDRVTGLLVPEGDAKALAERVGVLIEDPALVQLLVTNAREEVARSWDNAALTRQLVSRYGSLVNQGADAVGSPEDMAMPNDDMPTPGLSENRGLP